jgi:heat-inducible transcriptional repressor
MKLDDRKKEILKEVIGRFIKKAEPVSSQAIVEYCDLDLSSATIRKEMAELEEMGYLMHPHVSAGRIPSDKGYRFFVDNFIKDSNKIDIYSGGNIPSIIDFKVEKDMELETILQLSSQELAKITNYLAMIVAPAIYQSKFKHIEVLKFYDNNFLLVLITDTGRVFKGSFTVEGAYNSLDLQSVSNILNSHFRDKNIASIDFKEINIPESSAYLRPLIKKIIEVIESCAHENILYNRIFVHGTASVLNQPEFIDLKKIQEILSVIENEYLLMKLLLNLSIDNEFIVKIGSEIFEDGPDDLSLVASRYKIYGHSTGTIGVLGPKRMDYYKVINVLNIFIENLKKII